MTARVVGQARVWGGTRNCTCRLTGKGDVTLLLPKYPRLASQPEAQGRDRLSRPRSNRRSKRATKLGSFEGYQHVEALKPRGCALRHRGRQNQPVSCAAASIRLAHLAENAAGMAFAKIKPNAAQPTP